MKVKDTKKLVAALRCSSTTGRNEECCKECPYLCKATEEEIEEFCKEHDMARDSVPEDFWQSCDCEKMALDAAELIEEMQKEIAAADAVIARLSSGRDGLVGSRVNLFRWIKKPNGTIREVVDDRQTNMYHKVIVELEGGTLEEVHLHDIRLIHEDQVNEAEESD